MPAARGNGLAVKHGAHSETRVNPVATVQKRRLLRQIGLRAADLDALALGYLDLWARAQAKVELYDAWAGEHGYLTPAGKSPPWVKEYFAAINCARLSLAKFEDHVRQRGEPSIVVALQGEARRNGAP
jgi:hypothetical protein